MKKIYLVNYDNGEKYIEDRVDYIFNYCYTTRGQAEQAIEELKQNKEFFKNIVFEEENIENIRFWIQEVELVD